MRRAASFFLYLRPFYNMIYSRGIYQTRKWEKQRREGMTEWAETEGIDKSVYG